MKILGIVVEYNPFHTGHLYHLEKAKEIVQPDLTIAIMSGNYVQRGEVAIIDKFKRSELAIKYGVDLVIELPFVYVSQSADYFCKGAIDLLYHIGVTDLVFGSECGTIETFKEIAYAIEKQPDTYNQYVRDAMNQGLRYPDACNQALSQLLGKSIVTPNDLLGLGYVKEVIFNHYPINLYCIERSNDYHETTLNKVASATALRKALFNYEDVHEYLFDMSYYTKLYKQSDFFSYLKYQIIIQDENSLKKLHLVDEGIENLLKKVIYQVNCYDELVSTLTSKRYTKTRIQRMLLHILLNNTKQEIQNALSVDYLHILKMSQKGQAYLNQIKKTCDYKIITNLSTYKHPALDLEIKTSKFLALQDDSILEQEFKNIPIIK
ncbi:nucleotidyltransferase [Faecalibacillus faecis]|uniref:nucleotidyltransferase n=1 Tax=Faecalibacillus faecis TaxID=1982628 RepID=UPI0018A8A165|nr:nucleotidyltransferase [Faecalibacillus faecis]